VEQQANQLIELTGNEKNYLYNFAVGFCKVGAYAKALPFFRYLLLKDPLNQLYLKGLAGALHGSEEYLDALVCYDTAYALFSDENVDLLYYMANCAISLKNEAMTKAYLEKYLAAVNDKAGKLSKVQLKMQKRAELLLKSLPEVQS